MSVSTENFKSLPSLLRFFGVMAIGLTLDLWSKSVALARLSGDRQVSFIPGYLQFEFLNNPGAVFGLGAGQRTIFIAVSILAVAFLVFLFATSGRQKLYQVLLGMILAGVLGNLYDRIVYGQVRDMIHIFPRWPHLYPWVFNVADSMLCVGVFMMLVYSFINDHKPAQPSAADAASH
jgi:signal peptidase II